ncbi:MAG: hypothetical protein QOG54_1501 [Actinomycetota bacterium]|jgi:hypothetical protein|nr:hypothetical protein [Actinomycetota bacterium]
MMDNDVDIREMSDADLAWAQILVDDLLGSRLQARMDELIDVLSLPGLVAEYNGEASALLTYRKGSDAVEIVAICSTVPRCGKALIDALKLRFATMSIWLVTTNDNHRALRSYQRQGFAVIETRKGAVARARRLKPSIPLVGQGGIPMQDELVLRYEPGDARATGG